MSNGISRLCVSVFFFLFCFAYDDIRYCDLFVVIARMCNSIVAIVIWRQRHHHHRRRSLWYSTEPQQSVNNKTNKKIGAANTHAMDENVVVAVSLANGTESLVNI